MTIELEQEFFRTFKIEPKYKTCIFKYCKNKKVNGKWYIAKPIDVDFGIATKIHRFKDAYRVPTGKSKAYHFKEDEIE